MNESIVTGASNAIIETGPMGAVLILVIIAFAWAVHKWREDVKEERASHQATREKHLEDVRLIIPLIESLKTQMASSEKAIEKVLETARERDRR